MLEMPDPAVTFKQIVDKPVTYCNQCIFSGGKYTAKGTVILDQTTNESHTTTEATCKYDSTKFTDLTITAFINYDMKYEELFEGLQTCNIVANGRIE